MLCRPEAQRQLRRTGRSPSTATCHPATCSSLWMSTLGALADDGHTFIREIGRRAALRTADPRETTFLYQRFSTAIQRFNSIYAWPTRFQFPSPQDNHSRDFTNLLSFYAPGNEVPVGLKKIKNNNNKNNNKRASFRSAASRHRFDKAFNSDSYRPRPTRVRFIQGLTHLAQCSQNRYTNSGIRCQAG